ncbi:Uncharacterised protein [Chlamydia trachomatis]|nr:Uncharacterised protein [Chlamydia trachomatis]
MGTTLEQASNDIGFHATVNEHHFFAISFAIFHHFGATGLCHKVFLIGVVEIDVVATFNHNFAKH